MAKKNSVVAGEEYDVVRCSWCGNPAVVFPDKTGRPYAKCQTCGTRTFGNHGALELCRIAGRLHHIVSWPNIDPWPRAEVPLASLSFQAN